MVGNRLWQLLQPDEEYRSRSTDEHRRFTGLEYDRLAELQAEDYVQHGPFAGMERHGIEGSLETMRMFQAAFSDFEAIEGLAFSDADGEYACTSYTYRGTHDGDVVGIPRR